jgi:hypothetical protein
MFIEGVCIPFMSQLEAIAEVGKGAGEDALKIFKTLSPYVVGHRNLNAATAEVTSGLCYKENYPHIDASLCVN